MLINTKEKRILVITPALASEEFSFFDQSVPAFSKKNVVEVEHIFIETGTGSIENYIDDALVTPATIIAAIKAEQKGFDGIIINCMCDPAVHAVREAVSIPVSGTAEIAMHMASILGHKFGYIDVLDTSRTMVSDQVARYGLESRYGVFRSVNVPVLEIENDKDKVTEDLVNEAMEAVIKDHADVIVLGCGAFLGCDLAIREAFFKKFKKFLSGPGRERGLSPVPVIDPLPLAINVMTALVLSELSTSKLAYPYPQNKKPMVGYNMPEGLYLSKL
ncbi:aspartate/glutamate racemase family protein [Govanella unica]|uniref:Aspartate/glutamate racemase family protein n=1 Tax=Govanella unica TaxID=2975056 RepID=A0A9X3TYD3_9PROT|nr:aspartate/glutamate racemase family protein [Govania unica]MDA5193975.1 aspartate/glutamate racemase family protein [Govania unica]